MMDNTECLHINIQQVLAHFTLTIHTQIPLQGITAIYGPSGSGKTSLLRSIAGLNKQATGTITCADTVWLGRKKSLPTYKRCIGYVFQEANLFEHLSVAENLDYAHKRSQQDICSSYRRKILHTLEIEHLLTRRIAHLSGGERQRIAIARALLNAPNILLMDEPLSALDHDSRQSILQYLSQLKSLLNIPIIYVSHSLNEIGQIADQIIHIDQGKILAQGDALPLIHSIQNQQFNNPSYGGRLQTPFTVVAGKFERSDHQISVINVNNTALFIHALATHKTSQLQLRFLLWAKDISISLTQNTDSSILNILPATITNISRPQNHTQFIHLNCGGFNCIAQLTQYSCERLKLTKGMHVFAQIKAVSLLA